MELSSESLEYLLKDVEMLYVKLRTIFQIMEFNDEIYDTVNLAGEIRDRLEFMCIMQDQAEIRKSMKVITDLCNEKK